MILISTVPARIIRSLSRISPAVPAALLGLAVLLLPGCSREPATVDAYLEQFDGDFNVLIVSFDALRADALGIYGYPLRSSPRIDEWAEGALRFDNFYTAGRSTPTSFASAFSGHYPFRVFRKWKFETGQTIAEVMKAAGYSTFGVFNNVQLSEERGFDRGFDHFRLVSDRSDLEVIEEAQAAMETFGDDRFFGWVHFISPHSPYDVRSDSSHLYSEDYSDLPEELTGARPEPDSAEGRRIIRELYDGEVFYLDQLFGRILDLLEQHGVQDRTMVLLTSDHGEEFGEYGRFRHGTVHEPVIRVPLVVHIPGAGRPDDAVQRLHVNTDLLPTLADLVGVEHAPRLDGVSMLDNQPTQRLGLFFGMTDRAKYMAASRLESMKLIVSCPPPAFNESLYDLDADPNETEDVILDYPAKAGELFDAMSTVIGGDPCEVLDDASKGAEITRDLDEEAIEELRSLGYIQ